MIRFRCAQSGAGAFVEIRPAVLQAVVGTARLRGCRLAAAAYRRYAVDATARALVTG